MAYATAAMIADRLGRDLEDDESRIVEARLEDVELLIETRIPDLHQRVEDGKLKERLVALVEADVILRLVKNPEGYTQETDGNYSYSIDSRVASGRMTLLDEEWLMLGVSPSVVLLSPFIDMHPGTVEGMCDLHRYNPNWSFETGICYGCCTGGGSDGPSEAVWA